CVRSTDQAASGTEGVSGGLRRSMHSACVLAGLAGMGKGAPKARRPRQEHRARQHAGLLAAGTALQPYSLVAGAGRLYRLGSARLRVLDVVENAGARERG